MWSIPKQRLAIRTSPALRWLRTSGRLKDLRDSAVDLAPVFMDQRLLASVFS
jgi:hypothetical protein